jgi:glycosyltransferase involved in cell wall biosynthesis
VNGFSDTHVGDQLEAKMSGSPALSSPQGAKGISVIICTYNGADRIQTTLKALACCGASFPVEVVLVDNNSTDGTAQTAQVVWADIGKPQFTFSIIHEPQQGLSFARHAGTMASNNEIIVFVDDDNSLAPDYLEHAWRIMTQEPDVAVLGGDAEPTYASAPRRGSCVIAGRSPWASRQKPRVTLPRIVGGSGAQAQYFAGPRLSNLRVLAWSLFLPIGAATR